MPTPSTSSPEELRRRVDVCPGAEASASKHCARVGKGGVTAKGSTMAKARKVKKNAQLGRQDRWPSDYGVRQSEGDQPEAERDGTWSSGEQGPGREGRSKGYGG